MPDGTVKKWHSMGLVWELAEQIADFRKGNGLAGATAREVVHEIEAATCERLHSDPNWCRDADKKKAVRAALNRLSRSAGHVADGARILVEWFGDGAVPVPISLAQARANVCLRGGPDGKRCPKNKEGHHWLNLTADAVRAIAEQMQQKDAMKLRVAGEDGLFACAVCRCPLKLKVHVPLATILEHTDEETRNDFPAYCWLVTERQAL